MFKPMDTVFSIASLLLLLNDMTDTPRRMKLVENDNISDFGMETGDAVGGVVQVVDPYDFAVEQNKQLSSPPGEKEKGEHAKHPVGFASELRGALPGGHELFVKFVKALVQEYAPYAPLADMPGAQGLHSILVPSLKVSGSHAKQPAPTPSFLPLPAGQRLNVIISSEQP